MSRLLLPGVMLALAISVSPSIACSPQEQLNYLTGALYREANPNDKGQAAVAAVIFNRTQMSGWGGNTICAVVTKPKQFKYVVPSGKNRDKVKYALAAENAKKFLTGYRTGNHTVEASTFKRLWSASNATDLGPGTGDTP